MCTRAHIYREDKNNHRNTPSHPCAHARTYAYKHTHTHTFFTKSLDFATLIQHEITQKLEWSSHIGREQSPHEKGKSKEPRGSSWSLSVCLPRGGREPVKIFKPRIISTGANRPELFCFGNTPTLGWVTDTQQACQWVALSWRWPFLNNLAWRRYRCFKEDEEQIYAM